MLNGAISAMFGQVFGAIYLDAMLQTVTLTPDGSGGGTETVTLQACKVQQDMVREETRATAGYAQNERRFLILQAGVTGQVTGDSRLVFEGVTYSLSEPEQDPARSYWAVRAVPV